MPYLAGADLGGAAITLYRNLYALRYFGYDGQSGTYYPQFGDLSTLVHNSTTGELRLTETDGTLLVFHDLTHATRPGGFVSQTEPGGNSLTVTQESGGRIEEMQRSTTIDGTTVVDSYLYDYFGTGEQQGRLQFCTVRRQINSGSWKNIVRCEYTYYGSNDSSGSLGDLRTATRQVWETTQSSSSSSGDSWSDVATEYYRYYLGGDLNGDAHDLKYILEAEAFAKLSADVGNPFTASDAVVALYANNYFEYDFDDRAVLERVFAGAKTITYAYERNPRHPETSSSSSEGILDPNVWIYKTTETQPDNSQRITYANYAGQTMLSVLREGSATSSSSSSSGAASEWCTFLRYDDRGREIIEASPSAVIGYDEAFDDLLNYNSATDTFEYLRDNAGLINLTEYNAGSASSSSSSSSTQPPGYLKSQLLQHGQLGISIPLRSFEYATHTDGNVTVHPIAAEFLYPDETNPTATIETAYEYTFHSGTTQIEQRTTTLPAISTSQNGSGTSNTRKDYFNEFGYRTWAMDERGFITHTVYDIATGAQIQRVDDVDTSVTSGAPAGWSTPSGGGLNLITDFESDDQGRITQELSPEHVIDVNGTATTLRCASWTVYDDPEHTIRVGNGYATGSSPNYSFTLINPVQITKMDHDDRTIEEILATRSSSSDKLLPSDTFPQSSYVRWTTYQYTECCLLASQRLYHDIPSSGAGALGTNYDQTDYGYDSMKRRNRVVTPGGTITFSVFDVRNLAVSVYVGTDDTGATSDDPSGGGAAGNNMVLVTGNVYDDGLSGGDGNLTQQSQHVNATTTRVTSFDHDWRNRLVTTDGEIDFYEKRYYDNLDRLTKVERYDTSASGNLIDRQESKHDDLDRIYQTIRYGVDPETGTVGNSLTDNTWFDPVGNVAKSLPAGSQLWTKTTYDSLNRPTVLYSGYGTDATYADIFSVTGDVILEQTENTLDDASNLIQTTIRQRYHDAPAIQTGGLGSPAAAPKAQVSYQATYPDAVGRLQATADYGTNGGVTFTRSATIPARSDNILVTSRTYTDSDLEGDLPLQVIDPAGMVTRYEYDDAGRRASVIENYQESESSSSSSSSSSSDSGCPSSADVNRTTNLAYTPDGTVATLTAVNLSTGNQVTQYIYGTTLADSDVASSLLLRSVIYPDSADASDQVDYSYNRQAQRTGLFDQNGSIHSYNYDLLGRLTQDRVTQFGSGVDDRVRRIETGYEVRGLVERITSVNNATVGSGSVLNEVKFGYNDFGQSTSAWQAHAGAVDTMTTPKVQNGYASGSVNTIRPTSLTYPNGRVIDYDYGGSSGIDDSASRIASIIDDDSTHLADYSYLGSGIVVQQDSPEADLRYTLVSLTGSNDPDTGNIYAGMDRFGRIKDLRWRNTSSNTDLSRVEYGYDRASNRIWRKNPTDSSSHYDWLYSYDGLHRLKEGERGTLNGTQTGITNPQFAQCWTLDETGNWQQFRQDDDGTGSWTLNQQRSANAVNEITAINRTVGQSWDTPEYDKNGNMTVIPRPESPQPDWANFTADQWDQFTADQWSGFQVNSHFDATYDAWNRMVKLIGSEGTVQENEYDGRGYRIVTKIYTDGTLNETRHAYFTNQWQVVEERLGISSTPDRQFVWRPIEAIDSTGRITDEGGKGSSLDDLILRDFSATGTLDERLYSLQDANWNVNAVVNDSGLVEERYEYTPYGVTTVLSPTFADRITSNYSWETTFCGYHWDAYTGLYQVRNRYYSANIAVWLSRDPIATESTYELYSYVNAKPISRTDPLGLEDVFSPSGFNLDAFFNRNSSNERTPHPHEYNSPWGPTIACVPRYRNGKVVGSMGATGGLGSSSPPPSNGGNVATGSAVIGAIIVLGTPKLDPFPEEVVFLPIAAVVVGITTYLCAEHRKNKRKSNKPKHQKGQSRKGSDKHGGEKGDANRKRHK